MEAIYFTQVFVVHLFCAAVGIIEVVLTAFWFDWLKHSFRPWKVFVPMQLNAFALWGIMLKGSWTEQGALITGIIAGGLLVLAWRISK